jgi:hypothetical protein
MAMRTISQSPAGEINVRFLVWPGGDAVDDRDLDSSWNRYHVPVLISPRAADRRVRQGRTNLARSTG